MHKTRIDVLTIKRVSAEKVHDTRISVPDDNGNHQQHRSNPSRHDPRHHVFTLVLHGPVEQRNAAHQVDRGQDGRRVKEYYGHWNGDKIG